MHFGVDFKCQCWISSDPDESTLRLTAEKPLVGPERIIAADLFSLPEPV